MAYVDVPDTLINIVGAGSVTKLVCLATNILVPFGHLEAPYRPRKETSTNKVQEAGGQNKEELEFGARTTPRVTVSIKNQTPGREYYLYNR